MIGSLVLLWQTGGTEVLQITLEISRIPGGLQPCEVVQVIVGIGLQDCLRVTACVIQPTKPHLGCRKDRVVPDQGRARGVMRVEAHGLFGPANTFLSPADAAAAPK